MSTMNAAAAVVCQGCNRKFAWKQELAGKRVRCKCGHAIAIPGGAGGTPTARVPAVTTRQAVVGKPAPRPAAPTMVKPLKPQVADDFDALAALAADAEQKAAELPVEVREVEAPVAAPAPAARRSGTVAPPGFRARPTADRKAADRIAALNDPVRDHYVPAILLAVGVLVYAGFICFQYHIGSVGLAPVILGVSIMGTIKTALLVGGAFVLAGPLGVSFGDLKSAILKLAAISVFTDGVADWVDHGIASISGGHGTGIGFGAIGWAVSVGLYLVGMVYLFSMDITDARAVVVCLGIGSRIIRVVVILVLYSALVGNSPTAGDAPSGPVGPTIRASALSTRVDEMKVAGQLEDAREYIAKGNQQVASKSVEAWHAAGCPHVWYAMSGHDINGRRLAIGLIVQLPDNPERRRQCYEIVKQYEHDLGGTADADDLRDTGESYLELGL
jgi:hypothetical protein